MVEDIKMINKISDLLDNIGKNPHWLSQKTSITYRIVLGLCKEKVIPPKTTIGTLQSIATVLGVKVDDLYELRTNETNSQNQAPTE